MGSGMGQVTVWVWRLELGRGFSGVEVGCGEVGRGEVVRGKLGRGLTAWILTRWITKSQ